MLSAKHYLSLLANLHSNSIGYCLLDMVLLLTKTEPYGSVFYGIKSSINISSPDFWHSQTGLSVVPTSLYHPHIGYKTVPVAAHIPALFLD
ncbi:Uncharacterised protein [Yersinia kristensenii]|nr:Uncharacterised protein [Yersinia kristensenii]